MWCQSGELSEYGLIILIRVSSYSNQNGMFIVLAAHITKVQRQSSSIHNVVKLLEGNLTL